MPISRHLVAQLGDQIVERNDAQGGVEAIDDRYAPDMVGMHQRGQMMQIFIDRDANRIRRHDVFDGGLVRIALGPGDPQGDVAVGDDAAEFAVLLSDQRADVVLLH